jgi:hypothetical protein
MREIFTARRCLIAGAVAAITGLGGCSTFSEGTLPASTANFYPDRPGGAAVPGSRGRGTATRNMPATFDELFDAVHKAAFQKGLDVDNQDRKKGMLSGKGYWQTICGAGPCRMQVTFAAYIEEVDSKPTTRLTFVLDRHGFMAWGGEGNAANDFIIDVQKVLSAQR